MFSWWEDLWHPSSWTSEMQTPWIWHKWRKKKFSMDWLTSVQWATKGCSQWCKISMGTCFVWCAGGTVLGPLLFSLYINYIMVRIQFKIRLFSDDCVCYRQTDSIEDTSKFLYENMPIQIYWKLYHQTMKIFRWKILIFFLFLLKT